MRTTIAPKSQRARRLRNEVPLEEPAPAWAFLRRYACWILAAVLLLIFVYRLGAA